MAINWYDTSNSGSTEPNPAQQGGIKWDVQPSGTEDGLNQASNSLGRSQSLLDSIAGVGKFLGMGPLGESIARGIYDVTGGSKDLSTNEAFGKEAPTAGQVVGSALQTAALAAPLGETGAALSKIPIAGKILGTTAGQLGTMGALSGAGSALENQETPAQTATAGALGAGVGVATAGLGSLAQKFGKFILGTGETGGLPARLIGNIFKTTPTEQLAEAYKIANGEAPPTTLKGIALRERMMGDNKTMLVHSIGMLNNLEGQLQDVVGNKEVNLPNIGGFKNALSTIAEHIDKSSFGTRPADLQEADRLFGVLDSAKGNAVPAGDVLGLKRFIDNQRTASSFVTDSTLAPKQQGLKELANSARTALKEQIPDVASLLNRQSDFIRLKDAIVGDAVKRENKQVLGLADAMLLGGGALVPHGLGAGLGAETIMRGFQEPGVITRVANALNKAGEVSKNILPIDKSIGVGRGVQRGVVTQLPRTNLDQQ